MAEAAATALKTRIPGAFGTGGSPLADRTAGSSPRPQTLGAEVEAHADSSAHGGGWTTWTPLGSGKKSSKS